MFGQYVESITEYCTVLGHHINSLLQLEVLGIVMVEHLFVVCTLKIGQDGRELTVCGCVGGGVNA